MERTDLFVRSVGDGSDIVTKELYTFYDKSDRNLCLRPEFTSSIMRSLLNEKCTNQTKGLYYYGPAYRYERPQHGRYREFHQFGVEIIQSKSELHDFLVIQLCHRLLSLLCITESLSLHINSLGSAASMKQYRQLLQEYLDRYKDALSTDSQKRLARGSILRILDSKEKQDQEILHEAPSILKTLDDASCQRFARLQELLTEFDIPFQVDDHLVRGLDYYDNIVFEFGSSTGAVAGGGSYSSLARSLGVNRDIPCIGFSVGMERCMLLSSMEPNTRRFGVAIVILGGVTMEPVKEAARLATRLREEGVVCRQVWTNNGVSKVVRDLKERVAVFIGENELEDCKRGVFQVKDLEKKQQESMSWSALLQLLGESS